MAPSTATKPNLNGTNHVNGVSDEAFHTLIRHPEYYIQAADLFFLLRNVQFRVHRYFFERESAYFRAKLSAPSSPGTPKLGSSDNEPIVLTDVAPSDFEKLLWVFYNPFYSLYPAPASTWSAILALAHKWGFAEVKEFCVRELQMKTVEELGDIDRIVVYHDNDVDRNLLIPVYAALCAREQSLTLPEGLKLGMETTLVIASAREYVRGQIMADGSRTPITPNLEGDEMEKIVRDFFGIPIPEGSSASVNEVQAALSSLSLNARSEPRGPPPKLNVRTTNEPSGARAPNVRPPSPPQPLSLPQPDPSRTGRPLVSTLQVPAPPPKKPKSLTKKVKQPQQPQQVLKVETPAPTEEPLVPTNLPVSIIPPTPTQEKDQQLQPEPLMEQTTAQQSQDVPSPHSPTSRSTQEVDPIPQPLEGKQEGEPNPRAEKVEGCQEEVKVEEMKGDAEGEKVEARTKADQKADGVLDGEAHDEPQEMKITQDPSLIGTNATPDSKQTDITQDPDMNTNTSNDIEPKPEATAETLEPELVKHNEEPTSTVESPSAEEATVAKDDSQAVPQPSADGPTGEPSAAPVTGEEPQPTLSPLSASSKPDTSPTISTTPLVDPPGTPKALSKKKRKALAEAARKAAAAEAEAAQGEPQPTVTKEADPEPAPQPEPEPVSERPKTPPPDIPATTPEPLKLNIDKAPFVPEPSDVGTPVSELSQPGTPGTPTGRLSKKHRKALAQLAKKNAAEKAEQEAAASVAEASSAPDPTEGAKSDKSKAAENHQASDQSKQGPSESAHPPDPSSSTNLTGSTQETAQKPGEGVKQGDDSGSLVDVTSNEAAPTDTPASGPKAEAEASTSADDPWFTAEPDAQSSDQAGATTTDSTTTEAPVPPNSEQSVTDTPQVPPNEQAEDLTQNLPPKPSDDDPDLIPLAMQRSKDSLNSSNQSPRARVSSNSFDPKARPPSWPAPPSPSTPFSPTSTGQPGRTPSVSSTTGGRPSLNDRMARSVKGSNVSEKTQQLNKKAEEPALGLKKLKSWFG